MKPDKRQNAQDRGSQSPQGSERAVDPDQPLDPDPPFPPDPYPDGPENASDRKVDQAFQGKKHGEGDYEAARDYGKRVKTFVRSGQIERAADAAAPRDQAEAQAMAQAEREGRSRSKGEEPSTQRGGAKKRHE